MKKIFVLFAAVAALVSCTKENPVNENPVEETFSVTLSASAPSSGDNESSASAQTRTTLVEGQDTMFVHWSKGDAIKVLFFPNVLSVNATFSGPNGIFTSHFDEETSSTAFFRCDSWSWGSKVEELGISKSLTEKGIAVYPATATAKSTKPSGTSVICDTEVSFNLPSTQNAVKNNIESNLNFSYATVELSQFQNTISNGAQTDLKFNNVCAMIELTMPSTLDKKVTSISIASNNNVPLTGKGVATMSYYKNEIDSNPNDSASDHIFKPEISNGAGVTLNNANGFEAGATYYAVVWPGKHDDGLTVSFNAADGTVASKPTKPVTLTASKVKPYTFISALSFETPGPKEYDYIYADGSMGNDVRNDIVGVVIFHGNPKTQFNDSQLPDQFCNGLAISVSSRKCTWNSSKLSSVPASVKVTGMTTALASFGLGGYTATQAFGSNNYTVFANGTAPTGTSGWYLGAANEWNYIIENRESINKLLDGVGEAIDLTAASNGIWLPYFYSTTGPAYVYISANKPSYTYEKYYYYTDSIYSGYWRVARPIFAF